MAQCKVSPQEFIKNAFTPQISILSSPSVEEICRKNNLSFVDLVQPFCTLHDDVQMQEPNGGSTVIRNLKVKFMDINSRPPQTTLARKYLNVSVKNASEARNHTFHVGEKTLNVPSSTPWFEAWRETFLQMQYPSDHEFTRHFLACILVVSSQEPNSVDSMNNLNHFLNQQGHSNKLPKWFCFPILRYYVIVHDYTTGGNEKAIQSLETLKVSFGINNCFLLNLNSRPSSEINEQLPDVWSKYVSSYLETDSQSQGMVDMSPVASTLFEQTVGEQEGSDTLTYHPLSPESETTKMTDSMFEKEMKVDTQQSSTSYGMYLTHEDVEQIKLFVGEFCTRALIPHVEKQIQTLTEILSNRKGVSKSLFSATKRWFAPNKTGSTNGAANMPVYAFDAPELQMRKLGDLYFMFTNYNMAFQFYHAAKRDFNSDQALFYFAGALEMASLAAFMASETSKKTFDYLEQSITTYLNICKMPQFATRATLLSLECLKFHNYYGEAAHQLIRMTSEESDLLSALLLEQAAYSFLNCVRPQMVHKYAFHMVLAGHRFSKAVQKKHALRCYKQALQVYQHNGWTFAEDHINYTIGKLSSGLNFLHEAATSFSMLLTAQSKQSLEQQTQFLKDYLLIQQMLGNSLKENEIPLLILPLVDSSMTKILVGPPLPLSIPGKIPALGVSFENCNEDAVTLQKWTKLEEIALQEAQGTLPLIFKPLVTLYTKHNLNNANLSAIMMEPIQVSLQLKNPIAVNLNLKDLYLLWTFKDKNGTVVTNESFSSNHGKYLKTHIIKSFMLPASTTQEVILSLTPLVVGEVELNGLFYSIANLDNADDWISGKQLLDLNKLRYTKKEEVAEGVPISIVQPAPCLQVHFTETNCEMLCNEIQVITMEIRNVGSGPLHKVYLTTSVPDLLTSCEFQKKSFADNKQPRQNHVTHVPLPDGVLEPGYSHSVNIWLKAPKNAGAVWVDLLIYYENCDTRVSRYRVIRHMWKLVVNDSLTLSCSASESYKSERVKELLLSLKVVNLNKIENTVQTDITLSSASLLSSFWQLKHLENIKIKQGVTLQAQQSACLLLKAKKQVSNPKGSFSEVAFNVGKVERINKAYQDFAERLNQNRINVFEEQDGLKKIVDKEGILFLNWTARLIDSFGDIRELSGQSHFVIEKFHAGKTEILEVNENPLLDLQGENVLQDNFVDKLKNQVSMCIIHSSNAIHDFDSKKMCIIPVKISLHNDANVKSLISVNSTASNSLTVSPARPNLYYPYPSKEYRWVGYSSINTTVPPLSSEILILYVAVTSPGVYDLGERLELWCQNELYNKPVLQNLRAMGCLTVKDISS